VIGILELITTQVKDDPNKAPDMIKKAMEVLSTWQPNDIEEIELELHAELWCKLGRLSMNCKKNETFKVALFCAEQALNGVKKVRESNKWDKIPTTRMRWYAVAESLYGESLYSLIDESKQEKDSQDKILHTSVSHFVNGCDIAAKAELSYVLIEMCKLMWNAMLPLLDSKYNRNWLIDPISRVHQNLVDMKEGSDPDFLVLLYSALFSCINE